MAFDLLRVFPSAWKHEAAQLCGLAAVPMLLTSCIDNSPGKWQSFNLLITHLLVPVGIRGRQ